MIWHALGVFATMFLLDYAWAYYTRAVTAGRSLASANYATFITVLNGIGAVAFVSDPWLLIAGAAGAWAGTYSGIKSGHYA